ncbi:restriction endonuclease subunit S [Mesomycoplasma ovipneumoniae]|uniref:restriction endonuclease subunit S n=1 Tax=Mesomycoplasma ovipneumoniae TaxID=29562 RepID=UPI00311ACDCF
MWNNSYENRRISGTNSKNIWRSWSAKIWRGYKTLVEVCKEIYAGGDIPKEDFSKIKTPKYNVPIFTNGTNENALYGYTNKARTIETAITISARGTIGFSEKREAPFYPAVRLIVAVPNNNVNIPSFPVWRQKFTF